jgi:outer membrane protein OmpA-like peptidoglycan-associated protein
VRKFLVEKGIEEARLTSVGFGESNPIATNDTREGRALNRRVELQVLE